MKPARVVVLVIGCILLLPAVAMFVGGGALAVGYAVARDDDGYVEVSLDRLQTDAGAIRSEELDLFTDPGSPDWVIDFIDADIRITAQAVEDDDLFVGIGREPDVLAYLDGAAHDLLVDVDGGAPEYERVAGTRQLGPPADEDFWVATADGNAPVVEWEATDGSWIVVLMNGDAAPGIAADVDVGAKSGAIFPIAFTMLGLGLVGIAASITLIIVATRRPADEAARPATAPSAVAGIGEPTATQEHPVALTAALDPGLSRWMWLGTLICGKLW